MLIFFRPPVREKVQAKGDLVAARHGALEERSIVRLGGRDE